MSKRTFKIVITVSVLICAFMLVFMKINEETSAHGIERTLKPINKSISDNDITFTIGDVVKDGHERLHLEYHIKTKKNLNFNEKEDIIVDPDISINGKSIEAVSSVSTTKLGKNEYRGVIEISPEKELPNHYNVKFSLDSVLNQPGQWSINFSI